MINKSFNKLHELLNLTSEAELEKKRARLFPNGNLKVEDERVSCSIFLACMVGIKEFRESLIWNLASSGANKITNQTAELHAYTELSDGENRPDGLLVLTTGKRDKVISWAAYVEVKTKAQLEKEQVQRYIDKAKKEKVLAVITISNDFVPYANVNPTGIVNDSLFHWSWKSIHATLFRLKANNNIKDEDQVYIAGELIKYLDAHKDVKDFSYMGADWEKSARAIIERQKLKATSPELITVAKAWMREEKDIALKLSLCELEDRGCFNTELVLYRDELKKETKHEENLINQLMTHEHLISHYLIKALNSKVFTNDKQKKLEVTLKFFSRTIAITLRVPAKEGAKAIGQTKHLLRQLEATGNEDEIKIFSNFGRKQSEAYSLKSLQEEAAKEYSELLPIIPEDLKRESIKDFVVTYAKDLGRDFYSPKKVIVLIEDAVIQFYREVASRFIG